MHDAQLAHVVARLEEKCKEVKHLEEKLHNLENVEDGVDDDDDCPSSRNEDRENVELAREGMNVATPFSCSADTI